MNNKKRIIDDFISQLEKYHLGSNDVIKKILAVYFAGGNLLINDVPGTGKSHLATIISKSIDLNIKRIQFTSDLMASDLIGVNMYDISTRTWKTIKGPLFADIVFADEINRAPPQTQSALLEAMSEKQITLEGETYKLSDDHFVIATQNPNEFDGTYPLPEAQLDRFMACLTLGYLNERDEVDILMNKPLDISTIKPFLKREDIKKIKKDIDKVIFNEDMAGFIVKILNLSRQYAKNNKFKNGLSIRSGIALKNMSKAYSYINNLDFVTPDIVLDLAPYVLKHRLDNEENFEEMLKEVAKTAYDKIKK